MSTDAVQRVALAIEFDGRELCGWQKQSNGPTVQGYLEKALAQIEGRTVESVAAGRTDAGVHGEALLVHADVSAKRWQRSERAYTHGVNALLPENIRVVAVRGVGPAFHARFDCLERAYRYQIWNRSTPSALHAWRHWWMPRPLDIAQMNLAAEHLLGQQDFSSFRASGCQASSAVRTIRLAQIESVGCAVHIHLRADAFLYHMVRNLVGSLVQVGIGKWSPEQFKAVLESRDRNRAAATAPAHGLYFTDAVYESFSSTEMIEAA